jgi:hypothetical protein
VANPTRSQISTARLIDLHEAEGASAMVVRFLGAELHFHYVQEPFESDASQITRAYILQRFMNACAGRGEFPIKHNGSLFTVGKPEDPDFRRWAGRVLVHEPAADLLADACGRRF